MIKQSRTIFADQKSWSCLQKTSTGDYMLLFNNVYHTFCNGSEQCIDCTYIYSGTKLFSSYPPLKSLSWQILCLQVTTMWHALLVSGQPQMHSAWLPNSKIAAREQKRKLGPCPKDPFPYLTPVGKLPQACMHELDWTYSTHTMRGLASQAQDSWS